MTFDNRSSWTPRVTPSREDQLKGKLAEAESTVREQAGRFVYTNARMKKLERCLTTILEAGTISEAHEHAKRGLGKP